jgi:hypothetical protein
VTIIPFTSAESCEIGEQHIYLNRSNQHEYSQLDEKVLENACSPYETHPFRFVRMSMSRMLMRGPPALILPTGIASYMLAGADPRAYGGRGWCWRGLDVRRTYELFDQATTCYHPDVILQLPDNIQANLDQTKQIFCSSIL